jgi:AcrR family transcriptional regulator
MHWSLMQEKHFETITVQDLLDRARVSRSTFYLHYTDKDDLLMSDADEFFEAISMALAVRQDKSDRVAPVSEFFAHVAEMRRFFNALVASDKVNETLELARGHFARGIERRLAELPRARGITAGERSAIAFALAGSLLSLLTWWLDHGRRESPTQMDKIYHQLVWSGVSAPTVQMTLTMSR